MLLSILGLFFKIILVLLAVGIILSMAILFVPIRYSLEVKKSENVEMWLKVTWFLRILKANYNMVGSADGFRITVFNIPLKKIKEVVTEEPEGVQPESEQAKKQDELYDSDMRSELADESDENKPQKRRIFESIKDILDKIKFINHYPDKEEIISLSLQLLKRLFVALKPTLMWARGEIGLGDPASTGYVLAGVGIFQGMSGFDIELTGNFESDIQNIEAMAKGKITLWSIIWPIARFILAKPIWKIVRKIIFEKGDLDEQ